MPWRCTKPDCEIHARKMPEHKAVSCNCDPYRGYICCKHRTREIACVLLKDGTVSFDFDDSYIRYMLLHGRKAELDAAFLALGKSITDIEADYVNGIEGYRASDEMDV